MTKEEAIKQLKDNRALCINSETEPFAIAYDMAIKALEQDVTPTQNKCKWFLYDYRTLAPTEHEMTFHPYWRIPTRYKTRLKYCPYCGKEIDYSEVDADIERRGNENDQGTY